MDTITKSIFDDFCKQFEYVGLKESEAFERFAIYCVIAQNIKYDTISKDLLENMCIGGGNDWGIDGFALIVNGKYVSTEEEINNLLETNGFLSVDIFALQAKTSSSISSAELGQSLDGVDFLLKEIISEPGTLSLPPSNDDINAVRDLLKVVYKNCASFKDGVNPTLHYSYVTCANYLQKNGDVEAKLAKINAIIQNYNLINGAIKSEVVDKNLLKKYYDATKRKNEATIKVEHKLNLPQVTNIKESYLCLIPFGELKKLLVDAEDNIILSIFEDNVRAFQGENTVNKAIAESLNKGEIDLFTAMNNGITIIAKDVSTSGIFITLSDYQIVNGCQTCHILYHHRDVPNIDKLQLIVKIISSQDKELRDHIIVANNSQTEVKREQLISLLDIQRKIEAYYYAQNKYEKLYYERRSKQYKNDLSVKQYQIVTIPFQIKAFVSMILGCPDKVNGYYGSIIEQFDKNGQKVFRTDIDPSLYYTSALASIKLEQMFNEKHLSKMYKKVRYHLLYAFRLMVEKEALPQQLNSHKIPVYCDNICKILCDKEKCVKAFQAALRIVEAALKRKPNDNDQQSAYFTKSIKELMISVNNINKSRRDVDI